MISHNTSVMEAILKKMEEKNLEYEVVKKYLSSSLVEKLESEAQEMKMVKKPEKNTLPI